MRIMQLTAHFRPNVGGVETHLDDLVKALMSRDLSIAVLTYRPLQTNAEWKMHEKGKNLEIVRIPWISNLFYQLVKLPALEFIYLLPGLFLVTPIFLLIRNIDVIHSHGLVAGFVGVFWGRIFGKRVIVTTHSIYHFPKEGLYRNFAKWIFESADKSLGLSKQAAKEIETLGISKEKIDNFTYWIDLNLFKKVANAKKVLGWKDKFIVLFVGRLVEEKGVIELLQSAKTWNKEIILVIIGSGPLEEKVLEATSSYGNIKFAGSLQQEELPSFYSASDILIVPSVSEEGFGRVILEALACELPIIGSNRGAIPEAIDESVGKLIDITPPNIGDTVEYFYTHQQELKKLSSNCRKFAERRYAEKNVEKIIKAYQI